MLSQIVDKILVHSRTIQIMYMAKDIVRDCTLRCKVENAADLVGPIKDVSLQLIKAYRELRDEMENGTDKSTSIPNIEDIPEEQLTQVKADASRLISQVDKKISENSK